MRYGFDLQGGFWAIDDDKRASSYAYATSTNATKAKRNPEKVAAKMVADEGSHCSGYPLINRIREEAYIRAICSHGDASGNG